MDIIFAILAVAVVVEAVIEYAKTFISMFAEKNYKTAFTQFAAVGLAICLCLLAGVNIFNVIGIDFSYNAVGVVLTGIFVSRGANYVSDLIGKLNSLRSE